MQTEKPICFTMNRTHFLWLFASTCTVNLKLSYWGFHFITVFPIDLFQCMKTETTVHLYFYSTIFNSHRQDTFIIAALLHEMDVLYVCCASLSSISRIPLSDIITVFRKHPQHAPSGTEEVYREHVSHLQSWRGLATYPG